ncbi:MAG TPA: GH1 family beta-glucosidase [Phototrophicaceae bacterium]|jgi:beta-glucosidase|nr:GH1 family beta-glucosidase [Phototrophicaceae bacterium]
MPFPKDFVWGAATSSYQIEGTELGDGRGECIWQRFSHTPGKTANGDTGDVAIEHLRRYKDDVAVMKEIGLQGYRFSISWPRVIPQGTGAANAAGLDFYDRLLDELLGKGIRPFTTLYHWDLPQALQDRGGWENPESVQWFADYADLVTRRFGDRVVSWTTFNEPWCISILSNLMGIHAPGKQDPVAAYKVAHHLNLAHGAAVPVIRRNAPGVPAGITLNLYPSFPAKDTPEDRKAAQIYDGWFNRWFLDPIFKGSYPADIVEILQPMLGDLDLSDVKSAAQPIDFFGMNFYTRSVIAWDETAPLKFRNVNPEGSDYTAMDWEIYPDGLREMLVRVHQDYQPKAMYVTENGAAFDDPAPVDGAVEDSRRADYLKGHFAAAEAAINQGVPLKGYFVWSLMDNFEWAEGYNKRFGIIYVDYATQQRTLKQSALYYQDVIRQHLAQV